MLYFWKAFFFDCCPCYPQKHTLAYCCLDSETLAVYLQNHHHSCFHPKGMLFWVLMNRHSRFILAINSVMPIVLTTLFIFVTYFHRALLKEYPLDAEVPTTIKTKLNVVEKTSPINSIRFSGRLIVPNFDICYRYSHNSIVFEITRPPYDVIFYLHTFKFCKP